MFQIFFNFFFFKDMFSKPLHVFNHHQNLILEFIDFHIKFSHLPWQKNVSRELWPRVPNYFEPLESHNAGDLGVLDVPHDWQSSIKISIPGFAFPPQETLLELFIPRNISTKSNNKISFHAVS